MGIFNLYMEDLEVEVRVFVIGRRRVKFEEGKQGRFKKSEGYLLQMVKEFLIVVIFNIVLDYFLFCEFVLFNYFKIFINFKLQ